MGIYLKLIWFAEPVAVTILIAVGLLTLTLLLVKVL